MKPAVIFSGAGLSAESGIPTFRDANGLWENHRFEDVASPAGWRRDQALVLRFYKQRFDALRIARPNPAHEAIARLQQQFRVVNITQNIDDLLEQAGCAHVVHLHGLLTRRKCEWHHDIGVVPGDPEFACDYKASHTAAVELGERCPKCGGQLRPDVVWFGEAVDMHYEQLAALVDLIQRQDGVFICVGTSAQVYPAASLLELFAPVRRKFFVDRQPQRVRDDTLITAPAGEALPRLVDELLSGETT